jgi:hypothetical protein
LASPPPAGRHDGRPPAELYELSRKELERYPSVEIRGGEVLTAERRHGGFEVQLADGTRERAKRMLLAMGMEYRLPPVPGLAELWGSSVFHCPFCRGWEVRDQPLAVLANDERAVHMAILMRGWSDDVVLLTGGSGCLAAGQLAQLSAAGIAVDGRQVVALSAAHGESSAQGGSSGQGQLSAVVFADGSRLSRQGLLVAVTLRQRCGLLTPIRLDQPKICRGRGVASGLCSNVCSILIRGPVRRRCGPRSSVSNS